MGSSLHYTNKSREQGTGNREQGKCRTECDPLLRCPPPSVFIRSLPNWVFVSLEKRLSLLCLRCLRVSRLRRSRSHRLTSLGLFQRRLGSSLYRQPAPLGLLLEW